MANNSRIAAKIMSMGGSSNLADTQGEFIIQYRCTGPVTGQISGEIALITDVTVSEAVIKNSLGTLLANYLNPLVFPAQSYTNSDVRGLSI